LLRAFDEVERRILKALAVSFNTCEWDASAIGSCIPQAAKDIDESPRSAFKVAYAALMGTEKGPRLAPILAEMDRAEILQLLNACVLVLEE